MEVQDKRELILMMEIPKKNFNGSINGGLVDLSLLKNFKTHIAFFGSKNEIINTL